MKASHGLLILAGAALAVVYFKRNEIVKPGSLFSKVTGYAPKQPSQQYPVQAVVGPRVDNQSQPWVAKATQTTLGAISQNAGAVASAAKSVKSLWGDLSDMFGSTDDDKSNLQSVDDLPSVYESAPGVDLSQTDAVGWNMNDELNYSVPSEQEYGVA